MRLTSKGQITIPLEIREKLGLMPLTEVEFDIVGESVRIRKKDGRAHRKGKSYGQVMLEARAHSGCVQRDDVRATHTTPARRTAETDLTQDGHMSG
jgi:AbrB family looped-hinge helix DNA binding protein